MSIKNIDLRKIDTNQVASIVRQSHSQKDLENRLHEAGLHATNISWQHETKPEDQEMLTHYFGGSLLSLTRDSGVTTFTRQTAFKNGAGGITIVTFSRQVEYEDMIALVKQLASESETKKELLSKLLSNFDHFTLSWDENAEEVDSIASIFEGISMFKNKNDDWVTISVDPFAQF